MNRAARRGAQTECTTQRLAKYFDGTRVNLSGANPGAASGRANPHDVGANGRETGEIACQQPAGERKFQAL